MAFDYATMTAALDEIRARIAADRKGLQQAISKVNMVVTDLSAFTAAYGGLASEIDAYKTANPSSACANILKEDKDLLLADKATLHTTAEAIQTDLSAYTV